MKKNIFVVAIFLLFSRLAFAAPVAKLPFAAGEQFVVSNGYNAPPMHIKKDSYAIDFTQNKCDAYGKYALAAMPGTVLFVTESGYNGGYGIEVLVRDVRGVIERYAHMIPGSVPIKEGDAVVQGTIVGEIGNTGLVLGTECSVHPGTHIHLAMYTQDADGNFLAYDPEPLSGYKTIAVGNWYFSDNSLAATKGNLATLVTVLENFFVSGRSIVLSSSTENIVPPVAEKTEKEISQATSLLPVPFIAPSVAIDSSITVPVPTPLPSAISSTPSVSPPAPQLFFGGGGGGSGGSGSISVATPIVDTSTLPTSTSSTTSSSLDDPLDDSISACE
jgi:hypothetical protein